MRNIIFILSLIACTGCFAPTGNILPYHADEVKRMKLLGMADVQDKESQYKLAMTYCCEKQETRDYTVASRWFCRAAFDEHVPSQMMIANMYRTDPPEPLESVKLPGNDIIAYSWYSIAARGGDAEAMHNKHELEKRLTRPQMQAARLYIAKFPEMPCIIDEFRFF